MQYLIKLNASKYKANKLIFAIFFILFTINIFGQGFHYTLDCTPGYTCTFNDVETTEDGGYILVGRRHHFPFIMKINGNGDIEWETEVETSVISAYRYIKKSGDNFFFIGTKDEIISYGLINNSGEVISEGLYGFEGGFTALRGFASKPNGDFVFLRYNTLVTVNTDGDIVDEYELEGPEPNNSDPMFSYGYGDSYYNGGITVNNEGEYLIQGLLINGSSGYSFLQKLDETYNEVWVSSEFSGFFNLLALSDETLLYTRRINAISSQNGNFIQSFAYGKISANGELLWEIEETNNDAIPKGLIKTIDGNFALVGNQPNTLYEGLAVCNTFIIKFDEDGNTLLRKELDTNSDEECFNLKTNENGDFLLPGKSRLITQTDGNSLSLLRLDSLGELYRFFIDGKIAIDENDDCSLNEEEQTLKNWLIKVQNETNTYYNLTDTFGNFQMNIDSGNYEVQTYPLSKYYDICTNSVSIEVNTEYDTISVDFSAIVVHECPLLEIDITTPFLRRCFDTNYTVNYCNQGTIPAEDAYIEITFDQYLTPNSSTLPWTSVTEQTYTFELGDVAVQDCGTFYINVSVGCEDEGVELGQTHCVEAHIYPDSLCNPLDPLWDGSNIIVDAVCEEDSVRFFIQNTGEGNMDSPQEYIIIEDHIIFLQEPYEIPSGEEIEIAIPTDGIAYRMETAQNPGHPIGNMPSINVTGCNVDEIPDFLLNFWNTYPDDDISPFISVDCQQNIGSFDPNDKQAFPIGYGAEHFIEANTEIEYLIRFQNTGTDTAFTVVVEDVLSEYLDITTIRTGASSHPYSFDIDNGRKLKFTFNNILLADSTTNEVASHGFIKFKVNQIPDNQIGTFIYNNAAIFFDFNAPVITNTVFHEIGEDFIESIIVSTFDVSPEEKRVLVSPNPFSNETFFRIKGVYNSPIKFTLHDTQGRVVREETYSESSFKFLRKGLSDGLYFYRIEEDGVLIDAGKLVVN